MKKLVALVLALVMILAVAVASAATLTIDRDSTWDANADNASVTFTYYKIFDAAITTAATVDHDSGALSSTGNVVYTISGTGAADKVAALPTFFTADLGADGKYYITLNDTTKTAADIVAALKTMVDANTTLFPGTSVTSDANPVKIENLDPAYYLVTASNGKNLAVQTIGDVTIKEKNDYPSVNKESKRAADPTYTEAVIPAEIGTYIDYQITVHVPADANKDIIVVDTMSRGLEYDATTGLTLSPSVSYHDVEDTDDGYNPNATWQIKLTPADYAGHLGDDIVITYRAKITEDALVDTGKINEVTLTYDEGNYVLVDHTNYELYFAGIYKVDPNDATADMAGVKFILKDGNGNAVNVTYDTTNGYYVVDPASTSNEVETRAETVQINGEDVTFYTIKIRGLDGDKTYKLTETATVGGYNLLIGDVTLTKIKDEGDAFSSKLPNTFVKVENNKGTQLPSTGGIGTTIFYILGGLLVVGAAVILVARRKAHE